MIPVANKNEEQSNSQMVKDCVRRLRLGRPAATGE